MELQTHIYLQTRAVRGVQPEISECLVHRQAEEPVSRAQTAKSGRVPWECTARGDREKKRKKFMHPIAVQMRSKPSVFASGGALAAMIASGSRVVVPFVADIPRWSSKSYYFTKKKVSGAAAAS